MKASILIASYLSKDIWHRWFENPGSFLSRLLVGSLLGCLLFGVHLAFRYSEYLLEEQIGNLGLHNITVTHYVAPPDDRSRKSTSVKPLLANLSDFGKILHFKRLPGTATVELAGSATIVSGDRETLVALAPWLTDAGPADAYLFADDFPEGLPLKATYAANERQARAVSPPRSLRVLFGERAVVFLPEFAPAMLTEQGYMESFLLLGTPERIPDLPALVESLELLLKNEGFERAQVQSAAAWMEDLDGLRTRQAVWGGWFGVFCGLLVALVYGSITALEYRQNAFLAALIRSFGISPAFVLMRYFAESAILVAFAAAGAAATICAAIPLLGPWLDISPNAIVELQKELVNPQGFWTSMRWLCGGGIAAILPVAFALRRPIGRILG